MVTPRMTPYVGAALLLSMAGCLAAVGPACAQSYGSTTFSGGTIDHDSSGAKRLTMGVGKSVMINLPAEAAEVFIANPKVANAVVRSARKLYVIGLDNGQTSVFALDKDGHQIASFEVNVGRDIAELRAILKTAMPDTDIHVQTVNDTIILTGEVSSALEAQKAQDIAQGFVGYTAVGGGGASAGGQGGTAINFGSSQIVNGSLINALTVRAKDQVMLKVTVAEVQRSVMKQLGITPNGNWGAAGTKGLSGNFYAGNQATMATQPANTLTSSAAGFGLSGYGGTALNWLGNAGSFQTLIQAFEKNGVARVLAEPTVTAISGESAKFTAGGTIPITTQSSIDSKTGVCTVSSTLTPYGVTLNFTPTVLSEGRISLHLATEVTEPDGVNTVQYACSNAVGFRTRKNETTVELPSGGSIVSAGLIQQVSKQAIAGLPGLMNLPVLGTLFRSRDYQRQETELLIIVTPYIARSLRPDQVAKPDDGFADASDPQGSFLGRVNRIYSTANNPEHLQHYRGRVGFIND